MRKIFILASVAFVNAYGMNTENSCNLSTSHHMQIDNHGRKRNREAEFSDQKKIKTEYLRTCAVDELGQKVANAKLEAAIYNKDEDIAKYLISQKEDIKSIVYKINSARETFLHIAARKNSVSFIQYLISRIRFECKDVLIEFLNLQDEDGYTALLSAVEANSRDVVRCLIENGADIHLSNNEGLTPLMEASCTGDEDMVTYLLNLERTKYGDTALSYINQKNKYGYTALSMTKMTLQIKEAKEDTSSYEKIVQILEAAGAN